MAGFQSPLEAFLFWEERIGSQLFLRQPVSGRYQHYSYQKAGEEIRAIAGGIESMGLPKKSKIALLSKNCAHWVMADLAIMMSGHISVPIYPTLNAQSIEEILIHSDSAAIIVGKLDQYEQQSVGIPDIPKISVGLYGVQDGLSWEGLVAANQPIKYPVVPKFDDIMTIIYTSGTTGTPRGVLHAVGSFVVVANTLLGSLLLPRNPRLFSYLPLSHIAERGGIEMQAIFRGGSLTFLESLETFAQNVEDTRPAIFFAVPRVWSKLRDRILEKLPQEKLEKLLVVPVLGAIIRRKIRKKLGLVKTRFIASGAAPLSGELIKWYDNLGITIHQAYGMTEDCLFNHSNFPGQNKAGTVGKMLPGGCVKLSSVGEVLIKNDALMKGYYKDRKGTKAAFDSDGFLKTGDLGELDHDGYLTLIGRLKDQFKTDKGKYVSPIPIELQFAKSKLIEQIAIVGMGIPQPIALVVLSTRGKKSDKVSVRKELTELLIGINQKLEKHERVEKLVIMSEEWSLDNGLLTPTMKVRRNRVEANHQRWYKEWYDDDDSIIWE